MSQPQARIGDRVDGIYFSPDGPVPCGGTIITGIQKICAVGSPVAVLGSMVQIDCGPIAFVTTASGSVCAEGIGAATLGDRVEGANFVGSITLVGQSQVLTRR